MSSNLRFHKIDELRGLTLISMVLFHFCWDLRFLLGIKMNWYTGSFGTFWQRSICFTFILISGFCFSMSKKRVKRSLIVLACGIAVTLVTLVAVPKMPAIFGVLTFIGTAGLITIPLDKAISSKKAEKSPKAIKNIRNISLLIISFLLFIIFFTVNIGYLTFGFFNLELPKVLYKGYVNTFIGFMDPSFISSDYFSIFPWYFLYLCGYFIYQICKDIGSVKKLLSVSSFKGLSCIGRHSLIIYMAHQPVLMVFVGIINLLIK